MRSSFFCSAGDVAKPQSVMFFWTTGSFAIDAAKGQNANVLITADLKYHDFYKGENRILLIDAGHYESEQFTKKTIMKFLSENFPNFAFISSKTDTNPVHYF